MNITQEQKEDIEYEIISALNNLNQVPNFFDNVSGEMAIIAAKENLRVALSKIRNIKEELK